MQEKSLTSQMRGCESCPAAMAVTVGLGKPRMARMARQTGDRHVMREFVGHTGRLDEL
jgi:hypothetical protein